jgi:hypothetical protein
MKGVLKPLAVILAVGGIYFFGISIKGKELGAAGDLSTQGQRAQGQGGDIAVKTAPETELDDPEEITRRASLEPILEELTPPEPLTAQEFDELTDPEEITRRASLEPALEELPAVARTSGA